MRVRRLSLALSTVLIVIFVLTPITGAYSRRFHVKPTNWTIITGLWTGGELSDLYYIDGDSITATGPLPVGVTTIQIEFVPIYGQPSKPDYALFTFRGKGYHAGGGTYGWEIWAWQVGTPYWDKVKYGTQTNGQWTTQSVYVSGNHIGMPKDSFGQLYVDVRFRVVIYGPFYHHIYSWYDYGHVELLWN